jgi:hypothetical protein
MAAVFLTWILRKPRKGLFPIESLHIELSRTECGNASTKSPLISIYSVQITLYPRLSMMLLLETLNPNNHPLLDYDTHQLPAPFFNDTKVTKS